MMKRIMSFLLCLIMVLGLAAPSVQASDDGVYTSENIMDNIYIENNANVNIEIDGNTVDSSQDTRLPNPMDLVSAELPYTFGELPAEVPVAEEQCQCVDLASAVEHSGVCLVKAPYMELCEASTAEELYALWGSYTLVEQDFIEDYLYEAFPLKSTELQELLNIPTGSASENLEDGTTVSVEGIPQDGSVIVEAATDDVDKIISDYVDEMAYSLNPVELFRYDVSVQDAQGTDWQPQGTVRMELEMPGVKLHPYTTVYVVHVDDNGVATTIEAEVTDEGKIAFDTPGFSTFAGFTVDFISGELFYSIPGLTSIKLSEIIDEFKMPLYLEDIANVEFTNYDLISVEKQTDGDWLLTSLKAFNTTETLSITMNNGIVHEITVQDDDPYIYVDGVNYYDSDNNNTVTWRADRDGQLVQWDGWSQYYTTVIGGGGEFWIDLQAYQESEGNYWGDETLYINLHQLKVTGGTKVTVRIMGQFESTTKEVYIRPRSQQTQSLFVVESGELHLLGNSSRSIVISGRNAYGENPYYKVNPLINLQRDCTGFSAKYCDFRQSGNRAILARPNEMENFTIENCIFRNTVRCENYSGGAICVDGTTDTGNNQVDITNFTLKNTQFLSSRVGDSAASDKAAHGGAVATYGRIISILVEGCTFSNTYAKNRGGAIEFSMNGKTQENSATNGITLGDIEIKNTTFTGASAGSHGGAVSICYGDSPVKVRSLKFTGCTFTNCTATNRGGAIRLNTYGEPNLTMTGNKFSGCTAGSHGGALSTQGNLGNISITGTVSGSTYSSYFSNCTAGARGGAIGANCDKYGNITITNVKFNGMTASTLGGAVVFGRAFGETETKVPITAGAVSISGCAFSDNKAHGVGGGIGLVDGEYESVSITDSTFTNCDTTGFGGAIGLKKFAEDEDVLLFSVKGNVLVTGCTFTNCDAGAIVKETWDYDNNSATASGHGPWDHDGNPATAEIMKLNGTGGGGAVVLGGHISGKVEIRGASSTAADYTKMENCTSWNNGGAIFFNSDLVVDGATEDGVKTGVLLQYLNINKCFARDAAGAVYFGSCQIDPFLMQHCTIQYCGYFDDADSNFSSFVIWGDIFNNLSAADQTIYKAYTRKQLFTSYEASGTFRTVGNSSVAATIDTCTFSNNRSYSNGGGVYWNANRVTKDAEGNAIVTPSLTVINSTFDGNHCLRDGGGMYCEASVSVQSCEFMNNEAANRGGGIAQQVYNGDARKLGETSSDEATSVTLGMASGSSIPTKIHNNKAIHGGGISIAVYETQSVVDGTNIIYPVNFSLGGSEVYENEATGNGGGIYYATWTYDDAVKQREVDNFQKEILINNGKIYGNTAGKEADNTGALVKSTSSLKAGDQLVIAAKDSDAAMSTTQNSTDRPKTGLVKVANNYNTLTYYPGSEVLTLETGSVTGSFYMKTLAGKYLATVSSSTTATLSAGTSKNGNSSWKFTMDASGNVTILAQGSLTAKKLGYHTDGWFNCYASDNNSTKLGKLGIYRLDTSDVNTGTATRVTSASDLKAGDKILIVAVDNFVAMSATANGNTRLQVNVSMTTPKTLTFDSNVEVLTLVPGTVTTKNGSPITTFGLKTTANKYLASSSSDSSNNQLQTVDSCTDAGSWNIKIHAGTGTAFITAQGEFTGSQLRYNPDTDWFKCFDPSITNEGFLAIYKVTATLNGGTLATLVTNHDSLAKNDQIVIVALGADYAMSKVQGVNDAVGVSNEARGHTAVQKHHYATFGEDTTQVVTLVPGAKSGTFALQTAEGLYLSASSTAESLTTGSVIDDDSSWTLTVNATTGAVTAVTTRIQTDSSKSDYRADFVPKYLRFNADSNVFSSYSSASSQSDVVFYRLGAETGQGGNGGGVYMDSSQINTGDDTGYAKVQITGGMIYENTANNGNGGGVYLTGKNALCTITGSTTTIGAVYGTDEEGNAKLSENQGNVATGTSLSSNPIQGGNGGGIAIFGNARIEMENGYVVNNAASTAGGGIAVHGGSTMMLTEGYVDGNLATLGGGISLNGCKGDGVSTDPAVKYGVYFNGGNVLNNRVVPNANGIAYGGGICVSSNSNMLLNDGVISGNIASDDLSDTDITYSSNQEGGGIAVCQESDMLITGGTVSENSARDGGGLVIRGDSHVTVSGTLTLYTEAQEEADLAKPEAERLGIKAGDVNVEESHGIIYDNYAKVRGGGVYMPNKVSSGNTFTMTNGYLAKNEAESDYSVWSQGGGIMSGKGNTVTLDGGRIEFNEAYDGGGILSWRGTVEIKNGEVNGNTAGRMGGGIYNDYSEITVTGGKISNNYTNQDGGGIFCYSNNASGYSPAELTISGGEIVDNSCGRNGGGVFFNGNGLYNHDNDASTPDILRFENNGWVKFQGGSIKSNTAGVSGGGLYAEFTSVTMEKKDGHTGSIIENEATKDGAGAYLYYSDTTISDATIQDNIASGNGGGFAVQYSSLTLNGGRINSNEAVDGAGIWITNKNGTSSTVSDVTITSGEIKENDASGNGGGILIDGNSIAGTTILVNNIPQFTNSTYLTMTGGVITGNHADHDGGGIYASARGKVSIQGTAAKVGEISHNSAENGGGVYVHSGAELYVHNGQVIKNTATGDSGVGTAYGVNPGLVSGVGGGIYVTTGTSNYKTTFVLSGDDMAIYGNIATFAADDVFSNGDNTLLDVPEVTRMNLVGYGFNPEGWVEDYATSDTAYGTGLNMIGVYAASAGTAADTIRKTPVLRYRNAAATQRRYMLIKPEYVTGQGLDSSTTYANKENAYVCMTLGIPTAMDDTVVIDYGKEVVISAWLNDLFLKADTSEGGENDFLWDDYIFMVVDIDEGTYLGRSFTVGTTPGTVQQYEEARYLEITEDTKPPFVTKRTGIYGDAGVVYNATNGTFSYSPTKMDMSKEDCFFYATAHNGFWYYANMTVVPATTVYYEDNADFADTTFVNYHTNDSTPYEQLASWTPVTGGNGSYYQQNEDRPGDAILGEFDSDNIYGFDSTYVDSTGYSAGSAHKVSVSRHSLVDANNDNKCDTCQIAYTHTFVGTGTQCARCGNSEASHGTVASHTCADTKYYNGYCNTCSKYISHTANARATFTFKGTGFDIISFSSASTGVVSVSVYEGTEDQITFVDNPDTEAWEASTPIATYVVDTYFETAGTTLYQVPVIKADLTQVKQYDSDWNWDGESYYGYGTYTVEIYVAPGWSVLDKTYNGADFYLDAIRIYNPAGINGGTNEAVSDAYFEDGEAWPVYQEVRNLILTGKDFEAEENNTPKSGFLFVDTTDTPTIAEYKSWGPNNEVYLRGKTSTAEGQGISFKLNAENYALNGLVVDRVHLGMRSLSNSGTVEIYRDDETKAWKTITLSSTDMYYDITDLLGHYVTIINTGTVDASNGTGNISVSNLKVTHKKQPKSNDVTPLLITDDYNTQIALEIYNAERLAEPTVTPRRPALSFNGMVCYNVFFTAEDLGDLTADDLGLAVFNTYAPDGTVENASEVHLGATEINGEYMIATNGVNAKYLGDTKFFRVFAKQADGSYVYSKMVSYSARDYATNILAQSDDVQLKQLVVAMLNYGAEAQKFFGYKTYDLMNKDLTTDQQALVSSFDAGTLKTAGKADASKIGAFAHTGGFAKRSPAISFNGAFEINYFMTPANQVDGDMTMYFWSEDTYNSVTELTAENADKAVVMTLADGSYTAASDEIAAKYLDKTVYVAAVYESNGVTYCSGVLPYSIATYCQNAPATVQDLADAASIYGCAAKAYFGV